MVYSHDLLTLATTKEYKRHLMNQILKRVVQARVLAAGDFDELNALLAGTLIHIRIHIIFVSCFESLDIYP